MINSSLEAVLVVLRKKRYNINNILDQIVHCSECSIKFNKAFN